MIAIVTDSTICLSKAEAEKLGVTIVPMSFAAAGRVMHESYSDCSGEFERVLTTYECTTSQPSVAAFTGTFEELRRSGNQILCVVISSRLSGAYSSALSAAKDVDKGNIRVVDSRTTAGGMRFLAEHAHALIAEGYQLEQIGLQLEKMRDGIEIAFSVDNMEPLRKSGRLGFVRQSIGTVLNIRPMLLLKNGTVMSQGFSRGRHGQLSKLVSLIPKNAARIDVQCLCGKAESDSLIALLKKEFPNITPTTSRIGPVLAIHIGMPVLGVAWQI